MQKRQHILNTHAYRLHAIVTMYSQRKNSIG